MLQTIQLQGQNGRKFKKVTNSERSEGSARLRGRELQRTGSSHLSKGLIGQDARRTAGKMPALHLGERTFLRTLVFSQPHEHRRPQFHAALCGLVRPFRELDFSDSLWLDPMDVGRVHGTVEWVAGGF